MEVQLNKNYLKSYSHPPKKFVLFICFVLKPFKMINFNDDTTLALISKCILTLNSN